jgi:hypothetical protein
METETLDNKWKNYPISWRGLPLRALNASLQASATIAWKLCRARQRISPAGSTNQSVLF